jgi:hypothetical protein
VEAKPAFDALRSGVLLDFAAERVFADDVGGDVDLFVGEDPDRVDQRPVILDAVDRGDGRSTGGSACAERAPASHRRWRDRPRAG